MKKNPSEQKCFWPQTLPIAEKKNWTRDEMFIDKPFYYTNPFIHLNYAIDMHSHDFYEINIVLSGSGRHYIRGMSFPAYKGCVFVIPPNVLHGYWQMNELNVYHILIDDLFFTEYNEELSHFQGFNILFEIEPYLRGRIPEQLFIVLNDVELNWVHTVTNLQKRYKKTMSEDNILRNVTVLWIIGALCKICMEHQDFNKENSQERYCIEVLHAMDYIKSHAAEKLLIDTLAQKANLSRSTFQRAFHKITGQSVSQYVLNCRIELAQKALIHSEKSISDIAQSCGFYDSSHFSNTFLKEIGMLPSVYRNSGGKQNR